MSNPFAVGLCAVTGHGIESYIPSNGKWQKLVELGATESGKGMVTTLNSKEKDLKQVFPYGCPWNRSRCGLPHIVTACGSPPCVLHRRFSHFPTAGPGSWVPMAGITPGKTLGRNFADRCAQTSLLKLMFSATM